MASLSSAQFGSMQQDEPLRDEGEHIPLPGAAQTYTSSQRAMVWRKPRGVSGQKATTGTFYQPFDDTQSQQ